MTGISFTDLRIKIERIIRTRTMISINRTTHHTLLEDETLEYIFCTIPETIDAKISNDTPLEIPFSVMSSPSRIKKIDQTVIVNADKRTVGIDVAIILPPNK